MQANVEVYRKETDKLFFRGTIILFFVSSKKKISLSRRRCEKAHHGQDVHDGGRFGHALRSRFRKRFCPGIDFMKQHLGRKFSDKFFRITVQNSFENCKKNYATITNIILGENGTKKEAMENLSINIRLFLSFTRKFRPSLTYS
jgi:hypothetical protein